MRSRTAGSFNPTSCILYTWWWPVRPKHVILYNVKRRRRWSMNISAKLQKTGEVWEHEVRIHSATVWCSIIFSDIIYALSNSGHHILWTRVWLVSMEKHMQKVYGSNSHYMETSQTHIWNVILEITRSELLNRCPVIPRQGTNSWYSVTPCVTYHCQIRLEFNYEMCLNAREQCIQLIIWNHSNANNHLCTWTYFSSTWPMCKSYFHTARPQSRHIIPQHQPLHSTACPKQ
jgi:hypothetical protein